MSEGVIAQRYAQALFELGSESNQLDALTAAFQAFAEVYAGRRELRAVLENPVTKKSEREGVLREVASRLGMPENGIRGLLLLSRRRRLPALAAVARRLAELADEKQGVVRARVTTAQKMPESYYQSLEKSLSQATSRKVVLSRAERPSLLGGAVTELGAAVIDSSIEGRLQEAEQRLLDALSTLAAG